MIIKIAFFFDILPELPGWKGLKVRAIALFTRIFHAGIYFGIFLALTPHENYIPMKRLSGWVLVCFTLILLSFRTLPPADSYNLQAVATALKSGNVNQLSPFLDIRVDISLPDKSDTYSKSQAEMVIRDFFYTHAVQNFKITQQGENGDFIFCTGLLQTQSGNYRTTLFFRQKGDKQFVQEIRFQSVD